MIIDLKKFISSERQYWDELEDVLEKLSRDPGWQMSLEQLQRFHYLYQRASAGLSRISTFAAEPEIRSYLGSLTARAYCEVNEIREKPEGRRGFLSFFFRWFFSVFPRVFRAHIKAFALAFAIMLAGFAFGGAAVGLDPEAKQVIMPFEALRISPVQRVKEEEKASTDRLKGIKMTGAAGYMTHNIQVSIFTLGLGITYGIGTALMIFYNGVLLGAVAIDYVLAGKSEFLLAWLLPHGALEIPALLISGQTGLILAGALIGWGKKAGLRMRFRKISGDLVTLAAGFSILLVIAGTIESFISQYHQPVLPYPLKIFIGGAELTALILFLALSGARPGKKDGDR